MEGLIKFTPEYHAKMLEPTGLEQYRVKIRDWEMKKRFDSLGIGGLRTRKYIKQYKKTYNAL